MIVNDKNRKEIRKTLRKNQTVQESLLWSKVRNNQLGVKFRRQVSIGPYIADLYCREKLLVIEIDGFQHTTNENYDKERTNYFLSLGIYTLRFWNNEINTNMDGVLQKIKEHLG